MEQARFRDRTVAEATLAQSLNIKYSAPPNAVLSALSAAIFWGLQGRIRQTCKSLYPIVSTFTLLYFLLSTACDVLQRYMLLLLQLLLLLYVSFVKEVCAAMQCTDA
jgi:hypothetical protein